MTKETTLDTADTSLRVAPRKPRLALMGEFSAGKSTLSKLLLGGAPMPVRVTATRLPPVWLSKGADSAVAVRHDGTETPCDIAALDEVSVEDTRYIRLYNPSETLDICDLIDMPGISDPNLSTEAMLSLVDDIDCVVWCTPATQAWRQSEAAMWERIKDRTNGDNILLVTQADKLRNDRDIARMLARVRKETEGLFKAVYPISILKALDSGDDEAKWQASGAAEFVDHLVEMLLNPSSSAAQQAPHYTPPNAPSDMARSNDAGEKSLALAGSDDDETASDPGIVPKRVRRVRTELRGRRTRPGADL